MKYCWQSSPGSHPLTWASFFITAPDLFSFSRTRLPSKKGPIANPVSLLAPPSTGYRTARPQRPRLPLTIHWQNAYNIRVLDRTCRHNEAHTYQSCIQTISVFLHVLVHLAQIMYTLHYCREVFTHCTVLSIIFFFYNCHWFVFISLTLLQEVVFVSCFLL